MKKKLFQYLAIVILSSLLITAGISYLVNNGLRRSGIDFYGKMNYVLDKNTNINILLAGSSRILINIDPKIVDSINDLKSYNAGLNAATIKTCYNVIAATIKNQPHLKYIVLNIDFNMFRPDVDPYKDAYYYPFEQNSDTFVLANRSRAYIIHKAGFFDITTYDDYAKYAAIRGLLSRSPNTDDGFAPHTDSGFAVPDQKFLEPTAEMVTPEGLNLLEKIMEMCRQKNVSLILVVAPYTKQYSPRLYVKNYNEILDSVMSLSKKYSIPAFDYSSISFASDTTYFYNSSHLNSKGAAAYSLQIANDLKQYMLQKNSAIK